LLPFVENYNKSNYEGDNQIWSLAQGNDDAMYFANNYLMRYDGVGISIRCPIKLLLDPF
jgi:hypothetical protein